MRFVKTFWSGFDVLLKQLANVGMLMLFLMLFAVCWEVVSRYFLGRGTTWVIEFSEYAILCMTFLGSPWLLRENGHVEMDIVINTLQPQHRKILRAATSVLCALICLALAWSGAEVALDYLQRDLHRPTLMAPPYFPLFAVIPIGFFLLCIQFLRRAHQALATPLSDTAQTPGPI